MRDSLGGVVNIVIIVVFIVIALGYLAFNVNYTKAFRMKNKIISVYEDYNGKCTAYSECKSEIKEYASSIGYKPANLTCESGYTKVDSLYCVKEESAVTYTSGSQQDKRSGKYYKVVTKININIPIVDNILGIKVFSVSGNTKVFYN
jgi:hypothetical protein